MRSISAQSVLYIEHELAKLVNQCNGMSETLLSLTKEARHSVLYLQRQRKTVGGVAFLRSISRINVHCKRFFYCSEALKLHLFHRTFQMTVFHLAAQTQPSEIAQEDLYKQHASRVTR